MNLFKTKTLIKSDDIDRACGRSAWVALLCFERRNMIDRRKEVFLDGTVKREVVIDTGRLKKSMPQPEKHIDHETGKQY